MASLWDLINGYSQGGAPSEESTQTLGQAARDVYQGLINPQAWQEVQQATKRTQQVIPSVLESLARGSIAQVPGTAGDISALLRQLAPQTTQQVLGNRIAPTTDEILGYVPRMTPNYQGSESHEMMGGLLSPALGYFAKAIPTQMKGMPIGNMIAYHGTPHEIQGGFDMAKIGTGEGAQAYGHGMYFAENPNVAKEYQKIVQGPESTAQHYLQMYKTPEIAISALEGGITPNLTAEAKKHSLDAINVLKSGKELKGNLYKVDIPDEQIPNMLDWDKPFSKQTPEVQEALKKMGSDIKFGSNKESVADFVKLTGNLPPYFQRETGHGIYSELSKQLGGDKQASEYLNNLGIKGTRYLDQQSRGKSGTSNFVTFDPSTVKILEENGKPLTRKEIIEKEFNKK